MEIKVLDVVTCHRIKSFMNVTKCKNNTKQQIKKKDKMFKVYGV